MTEQDAIRKLKYLQNHGEGANVHVNADTILCDFLDAVGHVEIAREFRKVHEIYPTATPEILEAVLALAGTCCCERIVNVQEFKPLCVGGLDRREQEIDDRSFFTFAGNADMTADQPASRTATQFRTQSDYRTVKPLHGSATGGTVT